ncbi:serine protease inhibitor 3/4-like [Arctopsyche grandis]|uniref:serine protease inhibitor 3/4-like n=1 Tax=Arctopsyche grandis TaxID=121162 RepID=UPI00406D63F1
MLPVKNKTNNIIEDIVSSDALNSDTRVVLLNAIYFQGNWRHPFDKILTRKRKFNKNKIEQIDVDMIFQSGPFPYANLPEWDADILSIPYEDMDTYLTIIVPKKIDGLAALEAKIDGANITDVLQRMKIYEIDVKILKFKIETTIDLSNILPELGIKLLFDAQKAGLHNLMKNHEQTFVSDAKQKAFIVVDEQGTKAAAVSVQEVRDLGILIDKRLSFVSHMDHVIRKSLQMLGFLKRNTTELRSVETKIILFNALVRSHIEYAIPKIAPYLA